MEGFPFFVERGANRWTLTSEGSHTTTVRSVATITTRGVVGHLMAPMLKFQMTSLMRKTLEDLKHYVETGTLRSVRGDRSIDQVTDEAGAIEALGLRPKLVASDAGNLKVTWPLDLQLAEAILARRREAS